MGQKSTKENKNIYFSSRENANLTREVAADALGISKSRLERIEYDKSYPIPEEVTAMAEQYNSPALCNYFCSHDCRIGQDNIPEVQAKDLAQITLEMLATLNSLTKTKERFVEITVDGEISEDEIPDFIRIQEELDKMSLAIDSLKLWVDTTIASGKIDKSLLKK